MSGAPPRVAINVVFFKKIYAFVVNFTLSKFSQKYGKKSEYFYRHLETSTKLNTSLQYTVPHRKF